MSKEQNDRQTRLQAACDFRRELLRFSQGSIDPEDLRSIPPGGFRPRKPPHQKRLMFLFWLQGSFAVPVKNDDESTLWLL